MIWSTKLVQVHLALQCFVLKIFGSNNPIFVIGVQEPKKFRNGLPNRRGKLSNGHCPSRSHGNRGSNDGRGIQFELRNDSLDFLDK
jgi:hypothetical protein